ncbi:MAG: nuclear transport factor 2 family protein [Pseudomonadota bacterium]
MSDSVSTFFASWGLDRSAERRDQIARVVDDDTVYADPRTPNALRGTAAIADYVGEFAASAPGWSATVVRSDSNAAVTRVTVAFRGPGPDGNEQTQFGQYFVELEADRIARMVGFVGTGVPE